MNLCAKDVDVCVNNWNGIKISARMIFLHFPDFSPPLVFHFLCTRRRVVRCAGVPVGTLPAFIIAVCLDLRESQASLYLLRLRDGGLFCFLPGFHASLKRGSIQ